MKNYTFLAAVFLVPFLAGIFPAQAGTKTWKASTTGDWFTAGNWVEGSDYPRAGDDVVITNAGASVLLTNSTEYLSSLLISNTATLVFSNWNTKLSATNVTIKTNGVMTLPPAFTTNAGVMSNNVYVICSNLTIDAGGKIDVVGKGYAGGLVGDEQGSGPGYGFGGGWAGGAGHGGWASKSGNSGQFYGSIVAPVETGSGGGMGQACQGGAGGGAIRIAATTVLINGIITADGLDGAVHGGGAGSGGSIYIACRTVSGTGGVLRAVGGRGGGGSYSAYAGNGGGGRIAVIYDPAAQRALPVTPVLQFSVRPGEPGTLADIGTVYFSDNYFLANLITNINGQVWGVSAWSPGSLTVSNIWIRFPEENLQLTVTNDLVVLGSSTRLELGGSMIVTDFPSQPNFPVSATSGPSVIVGGNLIVSNGAALYIYAGMSNGVVTNYGALVTVAKDLAVATNSTIYPFSHARNGGSVRFRVRNLTVAEGGWINANGAGYASGGTAYGDTLNGLGPGGGGSPDMGGGGGYGGRGGTASYAGGGTYGSSNAPIFPGSGGGGAAWDSTGRGGGLVWIEATRQVIVQNKITANGNNAYYFSGAGSGGGIYITCKDFVGSTNGLLQVNGGVWGGWGGDGGGGRIAVWRQNDLSAGPIQASAAGGTNSITMTGQPGTIVWGWLPAPGTIFYGR